MVGKKITVIIRIAFAAGLLVFLILNSDADRMLSAIGSVRLPFLAAVLGLISLDVIVRSFSWGSLLKTRDINLSLPQVIYVYLAGNFFGTFIPSSLGTDVARMVLISRHSSAGGGSAALSILVMNLVNLLALCTIAVFSVLLLSRFGPDRLFILAVLLFCLAYLAVFPFLLKGKIPFTNGQIPLRDRLLHLPIAGKVLGKIQEFAAALLAYRQKEALGIVLLASFASHGLSFLITYAISLALKLEIPFYYFAMIMPVLTISRIIPLSIAGFGAEQGIFVYLFHQLGVPATEALLISLMLSLSGIVFSLAGGFLYVLGNFDTLIREMRSKKVAGKS